VFLERYVARSRHVEIQILGDAHGTVVHLGERECSIQRRHQKVVEEAPSPGISQEVRAAMGQAAVDLASALGYTSTGTVEFLVDDDTGEFFFLEVNTRLQVEHPVTEEVTGVDLVREQILVAGGSPISATAADAAAALATAPAATHAIEVRLYAEDPANGFLPATGTLAAFAPAAEPAVRWEKGVEAGSVVGVQFDPMLAKVVAHAPTRTEAASRLALALARLHIGGVTTNRDFLVATLRSPEFLDGATTTDFIDRVDPPRAVEPEADGIRRLGEVAALWLQERNRRAATVLGAMPSGWRNARLPDQSVTFRWGDLEHTIRYRAQRDGTFRLGDDGRAVVHGWTDSSIDLEVDGQRGTARITLDGDDLYLSIGSSTAHLVVVPRFAPPEPASVAGGFTAPMPGVVLDVRVHAGQAVTQGQTLVVLEAMKMEHHMAAPADGTVAEVRVAAGDQVANGALLLVFEPTDQAGEPQP